MVDTLQLSITSLKYQPFCHRFIISLIIIFIASSCPPVQAQFFTTPQGAYCAAGDKIDTDTLVFATTKAMPFDRCFLLKYVLPGKPAVRSFIIEPIDRDGKTKLTRRDYRLYLKAFPEESERQAARARVSYEHFVKLSPSPKPTQADYEKYITSFPDTSRRKIEKRNVSFKAFQGGAVYYAHPILAAVPKGKSTEVTLRIPPLEPNREYRIKLLADNDADAKQLLKIGAMVFKSQQLPADAGLLEEAMLLHRQNITARQNNPNNTLASFEGFNEFVAALYAFKVSFDTYHSHTPSLYDSDTAAAVVQYRLFFTPSTQAVKPLDSLQNFKSPRYTTITQDITFGSRFISTNPVNADLTPRIDPEGHLSLNILDTYGQPINLDVDASYQLQALAYDDLGNPHLLEVGTLKSSRKGMLFEAVPKARVNDGKWLEPSTSIMGNYTIIQTQKELIECMVEGAVWAAPTFNLAALTLCMEKAVTCPCAKEGIKDLTARDNLMNTLTLLAETDATRRNAVAGGLLSIDDLTKHASPDDDTYYETRKANLKASITRLTEAIAFIEKVRLLSPAHLTALDALLTSTNLYTASLREVATPLDKVLATEAKSRQLLISNLLAPQTVLTGSGSSSVLDLVAENKFRIVPDFGFVVFFDRREAFEQSFKPKDFSPYLGFNIGFRSIDKHIPWRLISHKTLWHHLSFVSGITLRSLAITGRREDFFNKSSLLTGLGYRLNNYLRVTTGGVWFKAIDPNPLSTDRPVQVSPFIGVSVDLDLKELFGGISSWFKL
ncbi:hypothetical protein LGH70_20870 [Hymenobacter sp. BT635]|uniref:DUF3575 domain-containing protein n=1 Tax=Hymenobacter nitidus TaxID=2880929 RepID=A0ABS8ALE5_9BACT|nr:hypothetical protein [Hymenobacter nitidus]MCB2380060.1 hypothetical protein [Hymenobacter nitidus]